MSSNMAAELHALRGRVAELEASLNEARDYIRSTMKLVHRQRAQEAIKAIDARLAKVGTGKAPPPDGGQGP